MIERLLDKIDPDKDGKINLRLSKEDINVSKQVLGQIPYLRGPNIFSLKIWKRK